MQPIYVTKNLIAASSTGIGTFSSAATSITVNTSNLGTARRIIVWGSSSVATTFTIVGTNGEGLPLSEVITGSSIGSAVATTQDFLTVTSVTAAAGVASTAGYIGTNNQGGTPWKVIDTWRDPINVGFNVTPTSTSVIASFEVTMDYPSYSTATGWAGRNPNSGPVATISTACSSVTSDTNGSISYPFAAWRVTLTSTSSGAGSVNATVIQSG